VSEPPAGTAPSRAPTAQLLRRHRRRAHSPRRHASGCQTPKSATANGCSIPTAGRHSPADRSPCEQAAKSRDGWKTSHPSMCAGEDQVSPPCLDTVASKGNQRAERLESVQMVHCTDSNSHEKATSVNSSSELHRFNAVAGRPPPACCPSSPRRVPGCSPSSMLHPPADEPFAGIPRCGLHAQSTEEMSLFCK